MDSSPLWNSKFEVFQPTPVSVDQVKQVHDSEYVDLLVSGNLPAAKMRRIGFPWSESLIERTLYSSGGTCLTAEMAIECGLAIHLSGGYHHAHHDFGSGFCLLNDLVLAAKHALTFEHIDKVLIVDSDVHHGDGTATLCQENDDIITLSFHCDKNFPARKPLSDLAPRAPTTFRWSSGGPLGPETMARTSESLVLTSRSCMRARCRWLARVLLFKGRSK